MRAVVLSLERRPDRLARFMGWNARHGLDFQVAAAVDGALLDRASLAAQGLVAADEDGLRLTARGQKYGNVVFASFLPDEA